MRLQVAALLLRIAGEDLVLPAVPLLADVGGYHDEGGHLARRQRVDLAVGAFQRQSLGTGALALQHGLHEFRARHGAEQADPFLGFLARARSVLRSRSRSNRVRSTYSLPYTLWNRPSSRTSRGWFHNASVR